MCLYTHGQMPSNATHTFPVCCMVCAGEMEVTQSRSEAAMSDRDPLSQPVHCEWACVLVFCSCEALQGT